MELCFDKIKSAIFGACRVFEQDGAIELLRFSESQDDYLKNNPDQIRLNFSKSKSSSGIVLDFYSNTTSLKINLLTLECSDLQSCFADVFVNDCIYAHDGYNGARNGEINLDVKITNAGTNKITIYFPSLFQAKIKSVSIDDGATFEPVKVDRTFYFLGDSITCGYISDFPSLTYANIITRAYNAHSYNHSIGGAVFNELSICDNLPDCPDVIFVAYGTNNWSKNKDFDLPSLAFAKRLVELYPNSKIVCITPIWRGGIAQTEKDKKYSFDTVSQTIKNNFQMFSNVTVIDGMDLVPHNSQYFVQDVLHPNALGFIEYAKNLKVKLDAIGLIK
jgi:hypothetical protein